MTILLFVLLIGLAIIAAIDYFWQRHIFIQGLRMTKQEIKDEFKQTEGSPEVKAKIRRKQMEASANTAKQAAALEDVNNATTSEILENHHGVYSSTQTRNSDAFAIIIFLSRSLAATPPTKTRELSP